MEYRGNPLDAKRRLHTPRWSDTQGWQDAVRRGVILGGVLAGHLIVLMLVLHPTWQRIRHGARRHEDGILRLSFDPLPQIVRASPTRATPRIPATRNPARPATASPTAIVAATPPTNSPPSTSPTPITAAPGADDDQQRSYQSGDFQARLQDAQRTRPDHIPGTDTPRLGDIQLQAGSSIREAVRGIIEVSRCSNEQFRLQSSARQFTPDMIDHMLEAIGCGPHLEHTAADDAIDTISRDATSGN